MSLTDLLTCVLIFLARIGDVSLGTLRTVYVVNGRRGIAWLLGFFEVLIWIVAVGSVITNLSRPEYAISYALGFATGNYVGMTIERWLAFGEQAVRIFTRKGGVLAAALRESGWGVTEFLGQGRDGPVFELYIKTRRRESPAVASQARLLDPECFYVVEDVRLASAAAWAPNSGWRAVLKRK